MVQDYYGKSAQVRKLTATQLDNWFSADEVNALNKRQLQDYPGESYNQIRGYAEVEIQNHRYLGFLDPGSDVSLISRNLLDHIWPEWRKEAPKAGDVAVTAYNDTKIPVTDTRWLKLRILHPDALAVPQKFVVTENRDQLLIGNDVKYTLLIGDEWDVAKDSKVIYGTTRHTVGNRKVVFPIHRQRPHEYRNLNEACIPVGQAAVLHYQMDLAPGEMYLAKISALGKAHEHDLAIQQISPCPQCEGCTQVLVRNFSPWRVFVDRADMVVEMCSAPKQVTVAALQIAGQIQKELWERLQKEHTVFEADDPEELKKAYVSADDVLPCKEDLTERVGFSTEEEHKDIEDLIRLDRIDSKYHHYIRRLLVEKYPKLVARHSYDCGDISRTLGYMYVPLAKPLPKTRKVYYPNSRQMQEMHDILHLMEHYKLISKSEVTYGAPIFLIPRKNPQQPSRLLAAMIELNECIADKAVPILPNITRTLESMAAEGVGLAASLDLRQAFHGMQIYPKHRKRMAFVCPFGSYHFNVGVMGVCTTPQAFQSKIWTAVHTHPHTKENDPIPGCVPYLDDVPIVTKPGKTLEETEKEHFATLDKVLYRLNYHDFRLSADKCEFFRDKTIILGHIISHDKIQIDPKRIEKILVAPMPTDRKSAQTWCGFLSSIKHFSPPELSEQHAIMSSMLCGDKIKVEPEHVAAFERAKEILTSHEFVLSVPDPTKPKMLYVDSSLRLASAILFEIDFGKNFEVKEPEELGPETKFPPDDPLAKNIAKLGLKLHPATPESEPNRDMFAATGEILPLIGMKNFPTAGKELRTAVGNCMASHPDQNRFVQYLTRTKRRWLDYLDDMMSVTADPCRPDHMVKTAAMYLDRNIIVVGTQGEPIRYIGSDKSGQKPAIWIGRYDGREGPEYFPLLSYEANQWDNYTSFHLVTNDTRAMEREEIFAMTKDFLQGRKGKPPFDLKVISYSSKIVAAEDRHRPIHELEAMALIHGLHSVKSYIALSPVTIVCTDSRAAYFLFSPGVYLSALKVRRWNLLLQAEYPNVLLQLVGTEQNLSDVLSRTFSLRSAGTKPLDLRTLEIKPPRSLDNKILSFSEAEREAAANPEGIIIKEKDDDAGKNILLSYEEMKEEALSHPEAVVQGISATGHAPGPPSPTSRDTRRVANLAIDTVNDYAVPVQVLAKRLDDTQLRKAQMEELDDLRRELSVKSHNHPKYQLVGGMIRYKDTNAPLVPPSLEGVALAYIHLITGHAGAQKMLQTAKSMFSIDQMSAKINNFARQCINCVASNPLSGPKQAWGTIPMPEHAFDTVYADLIEDLPPRNSRSMLVVTCYLTKMVYAYLLSSKKTQQVLTGMKSFLMHTSLATRTLITDNGAAFRSDEFLLFMTAHGIKVPATTPYSSKSRGMVETQNKQIEQLITKMLVNSPRYNHEDVYHLAVALLNNTYHESIKCAPAAAVYGQEPMHLGPWGLDQRVPQVQNRLLKASLLGLVTKIRERVQSRMEKAKEELIKTREATRLKQEESVKSKIEYAPGDVVFVKNFSIEKGVNTKFRANLYRSPFMVVSITEKALQLVRLTDNVPMLVHKDWVRKLRPNHELCEGLPPSVRKIIGGDLSGKTLRRLAEEDSLDQIYLDYFQPELNIVRTRARSRAQAQKEATKNSAPRIAARRVTRASNRKNAEGVIDEEDGLEAWEAEVANYPARTVSFDV